MVDVVPREVPRPKPSGPAAPQVLVLGPPEAQHSLWYLLGFFKKMSQSVFSLDFFRTFTEHSEFGTDCLGLFH